MGQAGELPSPEHGDIVRILQGSVIGLPEPADPAAAAAGGQTARRPQRSTPAGGREQPCIYRANPRLELQLPETPDANCPVASFPD